MSMVTSRAGKKRNTTLLATALSYTAGKLIVAVQILILITYTQLKLSKKG